MLPTGHLQRAAMDVFTVNAEGSSSCCLAEINRASDNQLGDERHERLQCGSLSHPLQGLGSNFGDMSLPWPARCQTIHRTHRRAASCTGCKERQRPRGSGSVPEVPDHIGAVAKLRGAQTIAEEFCRSSINCHVAFQGVQSWGDDLPNSRQVQLLAGAASRQRAPSQDQSIEEGSSIQCQVGFHRVQTLGVTMLCQAASKLAIGRCDIRGSNNRRGPPQELNKVG